MDAEINFLTVIKNRKYVVMAKMKNKNEIESYEVHFIRSNGYIARRKVWDLTNSLSESLKEHIEVEIYKRANGRINDRE